MHEFDPKYSAAAGCSPGSPATARRTADFERRAGTGSLLVARPPHTGASPYRCPAGKRGRRDLG